MANWNTGHNHFPKDVGVQCGRVTAADIAGGSYRDVSVTFPNAFQTAPVVTVCFETESTAGAFGKCVAAVTGTPTTTGFTMRLYNGDTSTRAPRAVWMAVGTPK